MTTGWNYSSGENWKEYVSRRALTNDLTRASRESTKAMLGGISDQTSSILRGAEAGSRELSRGMSDGFSSLGGQLDSGFNMLGGQMDMIAGGISELGASFEWGFSRMLAQMGRHERLPAVPYQDRPDAGADLGIQSV